jgi:hypothetical protein
MSGAPRIFIILAIVFAVVGTAYAMKGASGPTATTIATSNTLSPYDIHLIYKSMKELPVHDSGSNAF